MKIVGPILTFIGLILTWTGINVAVRRGRRELTANLLYNWSRDLDWAASRAIELAKELPEDVVALIDGKKEASVPISFYDGIILVLREKFSEEILPKAPRGKDKFEITEEHSRFIRFLWTRWLNRLEGTLAAWDQRAANAPVLERNFEPLVRRSESQIKRLSTEEDLPITHKFLKKLASFERS